MKKTNYLTIAFAIIAIIFAILYFSKSSLKTELTPQQLSDAEKILKRSPKFLSKINLFFNRRVENVKGARSNVENFRREVSSAYPSWVTFNSESIGSYVVLFDLFASSHPAPKGMKWQIGFFNYFKDSVKKRPDSYVIPTLVPDSTINGMKSYDMLNPKVNDTEEYLKLSKSADSLLYDFGDLHP